MGRNRKRVSVVSLKPEPTSGIGENTYSFGSISAAVTAVGASMQAFSKSADQMADAFINVINRSLDDLNAPFYFCEHHIMPSKCFRCIVERTANEQQ